MGSDGGDWGDYGGDSDDVEPDSSSSSSNATYDWPNTKEGRLSKRIYELEQEYESSVYSYADKLAKKVGNGSCFTETFVPSARREYAHLLDKIETLKLELAELTREPPEPDYSPYD